MFDGPFYLSALPEVVKQQCQQQPEHVPVVELHLGDGTTLDVCHIISLAPTWFAVAYFRNPSLSDEVEQALLPYPLVQWITLATHPPHVRRIGFDVERSAAAVQIEPAAPIEIVPSAATPPSHTPETTDAARGAPSGRLPPADQGKGR